MVILRVLIGVAFVVLGLVYLYNIKVVFLINHFFKSRVFSDTKAIVEHKKIGLFFLLLAIIFLYAAMVEIQVKREAQPSQTVEKLQKIKTN